MFCPAAVECTWTLVTKGNDVTIRVNYSMLGPGDFLTITGTGKSTWCDLTEPWVGSVACGSLGTVSSSEEIYGCSCDGCRQSPQGFPACQALMCCAEARGCVALPSAVTMVLPRRRGACAQEYQHWVAHLLTAMHPPVFPLVSFQA
jgi:hypothetical protein